jgi:ribosomal-protein-alanine N-acetyltransferase
VEGLIRIRPLAPADLDAVLRIQDECPEIVRWSREGYERVLRGGYSGWVAVAGEAVCGFLVIREVGGEAEILNFAVRRAARRQGIGTRLLREAISHAQNTGARVVFLEVRASNQPAIAFYERQGFQQIGRRRDYYSAPREDALLYSRTL